MRIAITATLLAVAAPAWALSDAGVARDGERLAITWTAAGPVDVYASTEPDATVKAATLVSKGDADGRHELADAGVERRYFLLRDGRTGKTARVAERALPLTGGSNFRDIGGYPAAGGKTVRWGKIFRSSATPMLTDADVKQVQALGLSRAIDLRSSEERQLAPSRLPGVRSEAYEYSMMSMMAVNRDPAAMRNGGPLYRGMTIFLAPHLRMVFDNLLDRKGPVMYHCTAGQDRTGVATAMILTALGTPRAVILKDYHLTTKLLKPGMTMGKISPALAETNPVAKMFAAYQKDGTMGEKATPLYDPDGRAFLESAFDEIQKRYGSVEAFLDKEVGVSASDIATLRATYTE